MSEIPREWQQIDIRYWFMANEKCPNCGIVLRDMHPMANLYPHWIGQCAKQSNHEQIQAAMLKRRGWECRWVLVEEFGDKVDEWRRPCA